MNNYDLADSYQDYYQEYQQRRHQYNRIPEVRRSMFRLSAPKVQEIFEEATPETASRFRFTKESLYSVSKSTGSRFLYSVIQKYYSETDGLILTDGTANIGSDLINLAPHFKLAQGIELKRDNYCALLHNILASSSDNIIAVHGNSRVLIPFLKHDIIYVDAPWTGPQYKKLDRMKLYLGEQEIADFYQQFRDQAPLFLFKVPYNYDLEYFKRQVSVPVFSYEYRQHDRLKYLILALWHQK